MSKRRSSCISVCLLLILFVAGMLLMTVHAGSLSAAPAKDADGYWEQVIVYDGAGLFSGEEIAYLEERAQELAERSGWDVRAVTTSDAGGRSAQDFLEDFYMDHYRQDDGVAFLIDMDNRELYIATSGEAIYYVTDERREKLLDAGFEYVADGRYAHGMSAMIEGTITAYRQGIDSNTYTYNSDTGEVEYYVPPKTITAGEGIFAAFVGLITSLGIGGAVSAKYKMKTGKYKFNLKSNSKLDLQRSEDVLVNRFVTTRRIPRNTSSGGSGSHGGGHSSTIHTGSGGHTFGGGGRKF